jgi:cobalt-zinc-cadmium efflux system protein
MGSTENAATAHLVLADQADATAVLQAATAALRDGFGIGHATLQLEPPGYAAQCAVRHGESTG